MNTQIKIRHILFATAMACTMNFVNAQQRYTKYDDLPGIIKSYKPSYSEDFPAWAKMLYSDNINFNTINALFQKEEGNGMDEEDGKETPIKRYYLIWRKAVMPYAKKDGTITIPSNLDEIKKKLTGVQSAPATAKVDGTANWSFKGPKETLWENDGYVHDHNEAPDQANVYSFDVSNSNPSILFAGTETGGVFRSTDGGQSWTSVNQGLEEKRILTLAVKGASLFAGTDGKGMFRSDDNGANWKAVNQGLVVPGSEQVSSITSIAVSGGNLILNGSTKALDKLGQIASLFRSKDNGETWEALKPPISSGIGRSDGSTGIVLAANDTMLFAGAYSGAYVSADLGTTWREISEGLPRSGFLANGTMSISALFLTPSTVLATAGFNSLGVLGGLPNDASLNNGVYSRELATLSCQYTLDKKTLAANPAGEAVACFAAGVGVMCFVPPPEM